MFDPATARVVEAGGQVLALGAPLDTLTLLHHAEAIAPIAAKRIVTYALRVRAPGGAVAERVCRGHEHRARPYPYGELDLAEDPFAVIARAALAAGAGVAGRVGPADCHLFDAAALVAFGVSWLVERFAGDR